MAEYIDRESFVKHYRELLCKDCQKRTGMKNGKLQFIYEIGDDPCRACSIDDMCGYIEDYPAVDMVDITDLAWLLGKWQATCDNSYDCGECILYTECKGILLRTRAKTIFGVLKEIIETEREQYG